ncbi:MAG: hypothetical protein M1834_005876 [Cirrosporium novae-zelandiae]|nr:MAG: hypothetical protein M1834_005876 [Cirrosporium novae-zelandiae]
MKLGEGGEAFFVFETSEEIPEGLQTSPLMSPTTSLQSSPQSRPSEAGPQSLPDPDFLDISNSRGRKNTAESKLREEVDIVLSPPNSQAPTDVANFTSTAGSTDGYSERPTTSDSSTTGRPLSLLGRSNSDNIIPETVRNHIDPVPPILLSKADIFMISRNPPDIRARSPSPERAHSPPPLPRAEAFNRAVSLSKKLSHSNIRSHVTETGDLMLDMTGYKTSEEEALRAEAIARRILAEELKGNYDIGALIDADENGNLWIYSSEEAKEAAIRKTTFRHDPERIGDAASDPGAHSDSEDSESPIGLSELRRPDRAVTMPPSGMMTPPKTPPDGPSAGDPNRNYAKTLRLTSDQLKAMDLKHGQNSLSFTVNGVTCNANMYYWTYNVPIVISDIDGTITKSDTLGHVLTMIGRDWTHPGVARLYTDIVANGYNVLYLTSRSVGQADMTRNYLNGINQEGYKLPAGPVILSPDRTFTALKREVILRKPEVFKMACLRDIRSLFPLNQNPFYAGFGNRLTDALSYRSVNIPSTRIFTINFNAEISLDLLSLNKYKSSYINISEVVDQFFPPVTLLVPPGDEEFTDFNYWRDAPLDVDDFSASEDEDEDGTEDKDEEADRRSIVSEDEGSEESDLDERVDEMGESYFEREEGDETDPLVDSIMESVEGGDEYEEGLDEGEDALLESTFSESGEVARRSLESQTQGLNENDEYVDAEGEDLDETITEDTMGELSSQAEALKVR